MQMKNNAFLTKFHPLKKKKTQKQNQTQNVKKQKKEKLKKKLFVNQS